MNNEHHVDWMVECMAYAKARGATQIEASFEAQENWMNHVAELAEKSLYTAVTK